MISAEEIARAKKRTKYRFGDQEKFHEHDDCVRIAYEWLDAQKKTKGLVKSIFALKHIIENWAGRYVSQSDVEVAAELHPEIRGTYPHYNISSQLTRPSKARLANIKEAETQGSSYSERSPDRTYALNEDELAC